LCLELWIIKRFTTDIRVHCIFKLYIMEHECEEEDFVKITTLNRDYRKCSECGVEIDEEIG